MLIELPTMFSFVMKSRSSHLKKHNCNLTQSMESRFESKSRSVSPQLIHLRRTEEPTPMTSPEKHQILLSSPDVVVHRESDDEDFFSIESGSESDSSLSADLSTWRDCGDKTVQSPRHHVTNCDSDSSGFDSSASSQESISFDVERIDRRIDRIDSESCRRWTVHPAASFIDFIYGRTGDDLVYRFEIENLKEPLLSKKWTSRKRMAKKVANVKRQLRKYCVYI